MALAFPDHTWPGHGISSQRRGCSFQLLHKLLILVEERLSKEPLVNYDLFDRGWYIVDSTLFHVNNTVAFGRVIYIDCMIEAGLNVIYGTRGRIFAYKIYKHKLTTSTNELEHLDHVVHTHVELDRILRQPRYKLAVRISFLAQFCRKVRLIIKCGHDI